MVQGIDPTVDYKKVLKAFKKEFCCNGTVVEDPEQARPRRPPRAIPIRCAQRSHVVQRGLTRFVPLALR